MDKEDFTCIQKKLRLMLKCALEDDKLFELSAKVLRKSFDALVSEGFTEDQAALIVANQGGVNMKRN